MVLCLVVAVTGVLGYLSYRSERSDVMSSTFHDVEDYSEMVDNILHTAMLNQSPEAMNKLVGSMSRASQVSDIAIYTAVGRPAFGTTTKPLPDAGKQALAAGREWVGEENVDNQPIYRIFRPIATSTQCYGCHQQSDPIAGVIQVDLLLKHGYERIEGAKSQSIRDAIILIIVITLVIWFFMSRTVVQPLRVLADQAGRISRGDLSVRAPEGGLGEVGELGESFNLMADELQRRIHDLEEANEKLETSIHRVADALSAALDMSSIIQILLSEALGVAEFELGLVALTDGTVYDHTRSPSIDADTEAHRAERAAATEVLRGRLEQISLLLPAISSARALYRSADVGVDELGLSPVWETVLMVPMFSEGQLMGQLVLASREHVVLSTSQRRALEFLSTQGATAVSHSYLHERTREMAITDGLTGLFDHRHFYETLEVEMARASRYGLALSVVLLDIDHFKDYNDRAGHRGGDLLLRRLATVLRSVVRETDVIARYGGEEFAIILPHTALGDAMVLAERIRAAVEREPFPQASSQRLGSVTVSVGVAVRPDDGDTVEVLVEAADRAMYAAKERGRNLVVAHEQLGVGLAAEKPAPV